MRHNWPLCIHVIEGMTGSMAFVFGSLIPVVACWMKKGEKGMVEMVNSLVSLVPLGIVGTIRDTPTHYITALY